MDPRGECASERGLARGWCPGCQASRMGRSAELAARSAQSTACSPAMQRAIVSSPAAWAPAQSGPRARVRWRGWARLNTHDRLLRDTGARLATSREPRWRGSGRAPALGRPQAPGPPQPVNLVSYIDDGSAIRAARPLPTPLPPPPPLRLQAAAPRPARCARLAVRAAEGAAAATESKPVTKSSKKIADNITEVIGAPAGCA